MLTDVQIAILSVIICTIILVVHYFIGGPVDQPIGQSIDQTINQFKKHQVKFVDKETPDFWYSEAVIDESIKQANKQPYYLIWLHGLGDTGRGNLTLARSIQSIYPSIKVILPTAPLRKLSIDQSLNRTIRAWHEFQSFSNLETNQLIGIEESRETINQLINQCLDQSINQTINELAINQTAPLSIDQTIKPKIILGGFSQGGSLAVLTGTTFDQEISGIISLSGYYIDPKLVEASNNQSINQIPIFIGHGMRDQLIPFEASKQLQEKLQSINQSINQSNNQIEFHSYPGIGHEVSEQELADVLKFIGKLVDQ